MSDQKTNKTSGRMPEFCRKFIVSLKRQPSLIPFAVFIIAFLYYSLNLTHISDTTAKIQGNGMGLCGFATMLFSMLSLMCFMNAFPRRKKPVIPMLILMGVMLAIIIFADLHYTKLIAFALTRQDNPITIDASTVYIALANNVLINHTYILIAGVVVTVLMPVYTKLLNKIDTSFTVDDYGEIGKIDISGED